MKLWWPHEIDDFGLDEHELLVAACQALPLAFLATALYAVPPALSGNLLRWYSRIHYRRFNGNSARYVEGKYVFTQLVRKLGYLAPDTALVVPGMRSTASDLARIEALDNTSIRLCKPLHASRGRGLHLAQTPQEALRIAVHGKGLQLVQNVVPPTKGELRLILHRTRKALLDGAGPNVRIAALKTGPHVLGDGIHSVRQLIARKREWPLTDRRKLLIAAPGTIPGPGEYVQLVNSGNISPRLHGFQVPCPDLLERMDAFILTFLEYLEARTGPLATVCFDIGLSERGPVFYEFQIPFGVPYGKPDGVFPAEQQARRLFTWSSQYSGRAV